MPIPETCDANAAEPSNDQPTQPFTVAEQACRTLASAFQHARRRPPDDRRLAQALVVLAHTFSAAARALGEPDSDSAAGSPARATAPVADQCGFRREGEFWTVAYEGSVVRLRDTLGLRYLAVLLQHPGRELHCTEVVRLAAGVGRPAAAVPEVVVERANSGPVLDLRARAEYRRRVTELHDELSEAEQLNDLGRRARLRSEIDQLTHELAAAARSTGWRTAAERARLTVTKAIGTVLARLEDANRPLWAHLTATVRRGFYCSYTPDPRHPIAWRG